MSPKVCSNSKTELWKHMNQNYTQNSVIVVTSKNAFFNRNSFGEFETATGFMVSKQVRE